MKRQKATFVALLALIPALALGQFEVFNHPELVWHTIETEHFFMHYHDGAERTAREAVAIAEMVYGPITKLYDYEPDGKVHWIIKDTDDYANGGTYYYDNKIVIWATPLDFELRGTHHWLYDVITHEFTHMIQLGAARKGPRWLPGIYFQYIGYEEERRPDVLYGYPNRIGSWPVTSTQVPMWFAEGTAQYQIAGLGHDWWDSHRDMMIRVRTLGGNLLTGNEMTVFGKSSLGSELVYCQGYALTRYIAQTYGEEKVADLTNGMQNWTTWTFDRSASKVLGISEDRLYRDWRTFLERDYSSRTEIIRSNLVEGEIIQDEGFGNLYPAVSPDGKRIAFLSNKGKDYLHSAKVYLYDIEKDTVEVTECPATAPVSWSPDGTYLVYSKHDKPNKQGSHFDDIYLWHLAKKKEIRLTVDSRLAAPAFSSDGKRLIAVHNSDGSHNLAIVSLPDTIEIKKDISAKVTWKKLTNFNDGRQIFKPLFSNDDRWITGSTSLLGTRDIFKFELEGNSWDYLLATGYDERDPRLDGENNRWLYYSSDKTGIFNIYRRDLITMNDEALTNVVGGSFMASISGDSLIAYSQFTEKGYGVRLLRNPSPIDPAKLTYTGGETREDVTLAPPPRTKNVATKYNNPFGKMFILPRMAWDYDRFKPGFYAYTNDFLDKLSLFGGVQANNAGDRDVYGSIEYRVLKPTLALEAYNIVRSKSEEFEDNYVIVGEKIVNNKAVPIYGTYAVDYTFNLSEYDLTARMPVGDAIMASGIVRLSSYKSALRFDDGSDFSYTYLKGKAYLLRADANFIGRSVGSDIHPKSGWEGWIEYARENNRFIEGFEIDADKLTLLEVYKPYNYDRIELELDYNQKVWRDLIFNPVLMAGYLSKPVDPFFHLYAGGLLGLRGYSYYSLGGTTKAVVRSNLRFPILTGIDKTLGAFYLDRIHGALFLEGGDAWRGDFTHANLRTDAGAELRIKLFSWYGFPTDISITGAYGLNKFTVRENDVVQTYGKEWRYYITVLFDFI